MQSTFIVAAVWLAGLGLRTFSSVLLRKTGALLYLAATYLAGYYVAGRSHGAGMAAAGAWFLLPWVEILLHVRPLRLPAEQVLDRRHPPSRDDFPQLGTLTGEAEEMEFERCGDVGRENDGGKQFIRLFWRERDRLQLAVCCHEQRGMALVHVSCTTRFSDGRQMISSDFPFSSAMKPVPRTEIRQVAEAETIEALVKAHEEWVAGEGAGAAGAEELDPEMLMERVSGELSVQVQHNVAAGILLSTGDGRVRYSWRGCLYLWVQYLKDLVRMA